MGDTFTQIYVHIIFSVKWRKSLIHPSWKEDLNKYITGIIQNKGNKVLAINGVEDHIHILIGWNPNLSISQLVNSIKVNSSNYINNNSLSKKKFRWQNGYGAFTHTRESLPRVIRYIEEQEEHHKKMSFEKEYSRILEKYGVNDKSKYYLFPEV